jgi:hypothetical protein
VGTSIFGGHFADGKGTIKEDTPLRQVSGTLRVVRSGSQGIDNVSAAEERTYTFEYDVEVFTAKLPLSDTILSAKAVVARHWQTTPECVSFLSDGRVLFNDSCPLALEVSDPAGRILVYIESQEMHTLERASSSLRRG